VATLKIGHIWLFLLCRKSLLRFFFLRSSLKTVVFAKCIRKKFEKDQGSFSFVIIRWIECTIQDHQLLGLHFNELNLLSVYGILLLETEKVSNRRNFRVARNKWRSSHRKIKVVKLNRPFWKWREGKKGQSFSNDDFRWIIQAFFCSFAPFQPQKSDINYHFLRKWMAFHFWQLLTNIDIWQMIFFFCSLSDEIFFFFIKYAKSSLEVIITSLLM